MASSIDTLVFVGKTVTVTQEDVAVGAVLVYDMSPPSGYQIISAGYSVNYSSPGLSEFRVDQSSVTANQSTLTGPDDTTIYQFRGTVKSIVGSITFNLIIECTQTKAIVQTAE
jgi:hypothetical protein